MAVTDDLTTIDATWRVLGASVTGVAHQRTGGPCQDAFHWGQRPGGPLILAVADGAGSAPRSEVGARLAVRTVVASLDERFGAAADDVEIDEAAVRVSFAQSREALHTEAEAGGFTLRDLACTLCVVIAGPHSCIQATIGDSGAILCSSENELRSLGTPQKGEYANETNFLTGKRWEEHLVVTSLDDGVRGIAVGSDGLMDFLIRRGEPVARLVTPLLQFAEQTADPVEGTAMLTRFLGSANVTNRIHDDVTLVLAWRHPSTAMS